MAFSKAAGVNGSPMINFAKWMEFHTCLKDVIRHKPPDISQYRQTNAKALEYLESQLHGIPPGSTIDQDLEKRSREILEQERRIQYHLIALVSHECFCCLRQGGGLQRKLAPNRVTHSQHEVKPSPCVPLSRPAYIKAAAEVEIPRTTLLHSNKRKSPYVFPKHD
jgi:hypothetical protein